MKVSIVIPVYNEEDNIEPLSVELAALEEALPGLEVLLVDDGSTDATWARICEAAATHAAIRGLRAARNGGQSAALWLGLRAVEGQRIVTLDGDLQNNPADIPALVAHLADHDVVCGYRATRRDSWSRRAASRLANRVRNWVTRDGVRDTGCSLKAFRRNCIEDLPPLDGMHRFMPAYFRLAGRSIMETPVDHRPRRHGTSKYTNLKRLPRGIRDLLGFAWYRSRRVAPTEAERT